MGKIINVKPDEIQPSQDFVKENTIRYILKCIVNNEIEKLPPTPIVRKNPNNPGYIALDGHNLIILNTLLEKKCKVYLAYSSFDKLKKSNEINSNAIKQRNNDLVKKYDLVLEEIKKLEKKGIFNFKDLRKKYKYLKSFESAKKHFNLN